MSSTTSRGIPAETLGLEELTSLVERFVRPVALRRLQAGPLASEAATALVRDAIGAVRLLSNESLGVSTDDERALVEDLMSEFVDAPGDVSEEVLEHHVKEAADIIATTWVDVLDQGCDEHGTLELHPELMIPGSNRYPELYEILEESLLPSVLSVEDAAHVMNDLRKELFSTRNEVTLPLGVCIHLSRDGVLSAERVASGAADSELNNERLAARVVGSEQHLVATDLASSCDDALDDDGGSSGGGGTTMMEA